MKCPSCDEEIPTSKKNKMPLLACPRCLATKVYKETLELQRHWIVRMRKGQMPVRLQKPDGEREWHIALAHCGLAWCGSWLESRWKVKRLEWNAIGLDTPMCEACSRVFQELREAPPVAVT